MQKIIIPSNELNMMVSEIRSGKSKKLVCKEHGFSYDVFIMRLKEEGISVPKSQNVKKGKRGYYLKQRPDIDLEWMVENWVNTSKSMRELAEQEGVNESLIDSRREMFGLKKHFTHPVNTEKLFNLEDPHVYYLAGLIATDGYVPKGNNCFEIGLIGESEKDLLLDIKNYFDSQSPIQSYRYTGDKVNSLLRVATSGLEDFLFENFNIPSGAKTYTVGVPTQFTNEDCAKAYLHGCMDGDGHISEDGRGFSLTTASETFVRGLHSIILKYTGQDIWFYYEKRDGVNMYPTISTSCSKSDIVLSWMYSLSDCFSLKRKEEKFMRRKLKLNEGVIT